MAWVETVAEDTVPMGQCKQVIAGDEIVLLVHTGQGMFATAPSCPHKAMSLEEGEIDGTKLTCPLHAATFDLNTGAPDEDTDWAGTLQVYPVEIREGVVFVDVPSGDATPATPAAN